MLPDMCRSLFCLGIIFVSVLRAAEPAKLRMVADLNPGANSSYPRGGFVWDDQAWFFAAADQNGKQRVSLYCSDGSTVGTRSIKELPWQKGGSIFDNPFVFESRLYFQGPNAALGKGSRVWVTDGTEAGTRPISEDGKDVCDEYKPFLIGERLVLSLHGDYDGHGLSALNLHAGTTEVLAEPFDGWEDYGDEAMLNGAMLKLDMDGKALWRIDGTRAGMTKLALPGLPAFENDGALQQLIALPKGVLMLPKSREQPYEFWHTDGASVAKLGTWSWSNSHATEAWLGRVGDLAVMLLQDNRRRCGLWSSDGTAEGSRAIWDSDPYKDANFSVPSRGFAQPVVAGERLFFTMDDGEHGIELWCSNGTREGTHLVIDIALGDGDAEISQLIPMPDGRVAFKRKNAVSGWDIWITDGTEEGSQKLAHSNEYIDVVAALKGVLLCESYQAPFGSELWALDLPVASPPAKPAIQFK